MAITPSKTNRKPLLNKTSKGIQIVGCGSFFKSQKEKYAAFEKPYKKLYEDQVIAVCKELPAEYAQLLSISKK